MITENLINFELSYKIEILEDVTIFINLLIGYYTQI